MNEKGLIYLICDINVMCYKLGSYLQFTDEYSIQKGIAKTKHKLSHKCICTFSNYFQSQQHEHKSISISKILTNTIYMYFY